MIFTSFLRYKSIGLFFVGLSCILLSACSDDKVRLLEKYPIKTTSNISPPIMGESINECAREVYVYGFAPGAHVEVWVNNVEKVGNATPHFGFSAISLTRELVLGESVTATQIVNGIQSEHSHVPLIVSRYGDDLAAPNAIPNVWECGRVVPVGGLVAGVKVKVFEDAVLRGQSESSGNWKSVVTNAALSKNKKITAKQFICESKPALKKESPLSAFIGVNEFPNNFDSPTIRVDTVIVGNNSVTLDELYVGAKVEIFDKGLLIGSGYANATTNWVPLSTTIKSDSEITATQTLCETSPKTPVIEPKNELPKLEIIGPICDDDNFVRIENDILNATILILQEGNVIGIAGAKEGESIIHLGQNPQAGKPITAIQYMGNTESPISNVVNVCACSAADRQDFSQSELNQHSPAACPASSKVLFSTTSNDVFEMELQADWSKINNVALNSNTTKDQSVSTGKLSYINSSNVAVNLNVTVNGRGHSRFDHCAFRPLKINFGSKQIGNIFAGHKKIKLVTHCGNHLNSPWILGGSVVEQRRRLLSEYYFYEVLEQLQSSGLSTRLAHITYKNPDGTIHTTEYAFWREREDDACQRCGWDDEANDAEIPSLTANNASVFDTDMVEHFVYNNDYFATVGHNTVVCKDVSLNGFYLPYDWDLTGVVRPEYFKNNNKTYRQNAPDYEAWLNGSNPLLRTRIQAAHFISKRVEMRKILSESLLDVQGKQNMLGWYDQYIRILRCFAASNMNKKK